MNLDTLLRFRRFIYSTRGLYLFAAQVLILWLKQSAGSGVSLPIYLLLLAIVIARKSFAPGRPAL